MFGARTTGAGRDDRHDRPASRHAGHNVEDNVLLARQNEVSVTIAGLPDSLGNFANSSIFGIPTMFVVMLIFAAASQFLLGATRLGRYMYALGSNIEAARRVGVNVTRVTLAAYGLASLFAAVGCMLLIARLTMGNPNAGMGAELQAIAAAVVGGASLFGGRGTIGGCLVGAILFTTIGNGANLLGVNPFW